jgi:hypothetical protein
MSGNDLNDWFGVTWTVAAWAVGILFVLVKAYFLLAAVVGLRFASEKGVDWIQNTAQRQKEAHERSTSRTADPDLYVSRKAKP